MEELQKASDDTNQENGLLRAQVERLQVELKEYRKRLSWVTSGSGMSAMSAIPSAYSKGIHGLNNNEFLFDFPKFGDLPGSHIFDNGQNKSSKDAQSARNAPSAPGVLSRDALDKSKTVGISTASRQEPFARSGSGTPKGNIDQSTTLPNKSANTQAHKPSAVHDGKFNHDTSNSNSDSPSSSCESHRSRIPSSKGTSPEPNPNSPYTGKPNEAHGDHTACGSINGESSFCAQLGLACGNIKNPIPAVRGSSASATNTPNQQDPPEDSGLDTMAHQNGGQFDPVLFGDWREPQDAVLSQDFGTFFDDAFPLPDLGSPSHNFNDLVDPAAQKKNPIEETGKLDDEDEVVPGEDQTKMLSCNKIWYVLLCLFKC